jgi:autotransporter-associated beta strand protein
MPRPLGSSLARCTSALAVGAVLSLATAHSAKGATNTWIGDAAPTPGDGFLWTNSLNWTGDLLPAVTDDVVFADPGATVGTIHLGGNQSVNSISFNRSFTLGAFGYGGTLTNTTGNISVSSGTFATVNAVLAGTNGLTLSGGGTLYVTNPFNTFAGGVTVNGTGTTLMINPGLPPAPNSRGDAYQLGGPVTKTVTLSNGGELRIVGASYNPDGATKNIVLGTGGGALNVVSGYQQYTIDDASQISGTGGLTKNGSGRLTFTGTAVANEYLIGSTGNNHVLNAGVLEFTRTAGGTSGNRFAAFNAASTITVNGGLLVPNANIGILDNNLTLNGGALGTQNGDNEYGVRTGTGTSLVLNGGAILTRDALNPQGQRFTRINSLISGSGTIDLYGSTQSGTTARIVFQRGDLAHTFNGTFVLRDSTVLEQNPRNGATVNIGKTFGDATLELQGFNTQLDLRDNGTASNSNLGAYTTNDIKLTSTQAGAFNRILVNQNAAGQTGNTFNFDNLSIGSQRLQINGANSYALRVNSLTLNGTPTLDVASANLQVDGTVNESASGQGIVKFGNAQLAFTGAANISNLDIRHGMVSLQGAAGAINAGSISGAGSITINGQGRANNAALAGGVLHVNNTGGTVANRLSNTVPITMLSESTLRLSSETAAAVTSDETTGNITVPFGNPTFDSVRGNAGALSVLTLGTAPLSRGSNTVLNFTGTSLGTTGNTSRIILPGQADSTFLGGNTVSGNEFAKYSNTVDTGFALGVTAFTAGDYTAIPNEAALGTGLHGKITANAAAVAPVTLTADRAINSLNFQPTVAAAAGQSNLDTAGFLLTVESGGLLASGQTATIVGTSTGGITAGTTAAAASLFITNSATLNLNAVIRDNAAGGAVTLVKSGIGTLILNNQTTPGHLNTMTGGVVINGGVLNTFRGSYLGAGPVTLAGGQLEVNVPNSGVNNVNLAGFGQNVIVEGNSFLGLDNNGETGGSGTNNTAGFGSLTVNGAHTLGLGGFDGYDASFTSATFTGTPTVNLGVGRDTNFVAVINGVQSGSGFNVIANGSNPGSYVLGGGTSDAAANPALSGPITIYGGTVRLNKANGVAAIADSAASEDIIINGGTLAWGTGQYLTETGNFGTRSNGTSGMDQITDTASITLLSGNLGANSQYNNETFATLVMKNGTLNPGLGTMNIGSATISGGGVAFNSGSTLSVGTLNVLAGGPNLDVANANLVSGVTTLEIGAGGLTLAGQNVTLNTGGNTAAGSGGAVLKLGGNLTVNDDPLNAQSYLRGIFFQQGRELGKNILDLAGGNRTFTIDSDVFFTINTMITNGGITKAGPGQLVIANYMPSSFDGPVQVNEGTLDVRTPTALGTSAGGTTVASGATLKVSGSLILGDALNITGEGALVPNTTVREQGALVSEGGANVLTGALALGGDATIAANAAQLPAGINTPIIRSSLRINAGGVTGTGTLTLTGNGDGVIQNGVNTAAGGLTKSGRGTWTIAGASSYAGATIVSAGTLSIRNSGALGGTAAGTTVYGGAALELAGGISVSAEALTLNGSGVAGTGALRNASGNNTYGGAVTLGSSAVITSDNGSLVLSNASSISGGNVDLSLSGSGDGTIQGSIALGNTTLTKSGTGTWTLRGGNTFTGGTSILGGGLVLDYTSNNSSKLDSTSSLTLGGGSLSVLGNGTASTSQTVNGVSLTSGGATIGVTSGAGQSATLNLGAIARSGNATVNFALPASGAVTTTNTVTNGILGSYATVGGTDWATKSGSNIVALNAYTPLASATGTDTDNSLVNASQTQAGSVTTNSLKISGGRGLVLGGNNLTLTSGGLLATGAGNRGIGGTGVLSGATSADELIVHTASGAVLDIAAPIIGAGAGSLTKAGAGELQLTGTSAFTGNINVNQGTLGIVGPGGTTDPLSLGAAGARTINVNGGTFSVTTGSYDPNAGTKSFVVGPAGGGFHVANGTLLLNDAAQLAGSGTLIKTGTGRLSLGSDYSAFTGSTVIQGGIVSVTNGTGLGGRAEQTITVNPGTVLIGTGTMGNNIISNGGLLGTSGGDQTFTGTVTLNGSNRIVLADFDSVGTSRNMTMTNRVVGGGTIDLFAVGNGQALFLTSGANEIGAVNLRANASLEVRTSGSIGNGLAPTDITLNGANSRYILRDYKDGVYNSNVTVNAQASIDLAQLGNTALTGNGTTGPGNNILTINDLTVNGSQIFTVATANGFTLRANGTTTFNGNAPLNATGNLMLPTGINFASGTILDKRGTGTVSLFGPSNHSGTTIVQGGNLWLRGSTGALPNTTAIEIRGGTLTVDNGDAVNANRLPDSAPITLAGGTLRVAGAETIGTVTATNGFTTIAYGEPSISTPVPLTLTGFTRQNGSAINFVSDFQALGATTTNMVQPRILIPGQADVIGTDVLPWAVSGNEFIQYNNALDNGIPRGVVVLTNNAVAGYNNDPAENTWTSGIINRLTGTTATTALTANRTLQAAKFDGGARGTNESGRRIDLAGFSLNFTSGNIIHVNNTQAIGNSNGATAGVLTAGTPGSPASLSFTVNAGTLEIGPTSTNGTAAGLTGSVVIADNGVGGAVSLVKNGSGQLQLRNNAVPSTFTGGVYVNAGTLDVWRAGNLGSNTVTISGGNFQPNVPVPVASGDNQNVAFGNNIVVLGNSTMLGDNNGELTDAQASNDNNFNFGSLTVNNGATFGLAAFNSNDYTFTSASFAGTPTIDMVSRDVNHTSTINGVVSGSGFYLAGSGGGNNGVFELAGGANANTYSGQVILNGGFLRLAKTAGTTNLTADANPATFDIIVNGGELRQGAADQIDNNANVQVNGGVFFIGQGNNETIASLEVNGGTAATGALTSGSAIMNITGDVVVRGNNNALGGLIVDNLTTLNIGGTLTVTDYGRVTFRAGLAAGPTATALVVNNVNLTGASIVGEIGGNQTRMRLNGDLTTNPSLVSSQINGSNDTDTFLELNGTRTFNVADGDAGDDLIVSTVIIDSTSPVATGGIIKTGAGVMTIGGTTTAVGNSFSGPVMVNAGTLDLARNAGVNAIGAGGLTIGDGVGGVNADKVRLRASNQIPDTATLTIGSSGVLDLELTNASETVASVADGVGGGGNILVGPNSVFGTSAVSGTATFSGAILGAGGFTKGGGYTQVLSGASEFVGGTTVSAGTLIVDGSITGSLVTVNLGATLGGSGTINGPITVSGTLAPGNSPGDLTANGAVTFNSGSSFSIELNGGAVGSGYDQLTVGSSGSVTITGGNFSLSLGFAPAFGQQFTVIDNLGAGAIGGTFANLGEGGTISATFDFVTYDFTATYSGGTGNDLVLTVPEPTSAMALTVGLGLCAGLRRFRRRSSL